MSLDNSEAFREYAKALLRHQIWVLDGKEDDMDVELADYDRFWQVMDEADRGRARILSTELFRLTNT